MVFNIDRTNISFDIVFELFNVEIGEAQYVGIVLTCSIINHPDGMLKWNRTSPLSLRADTRRASNALLDLLDPMFLVTMVSTAKAENSGQAFAQTKCCYFTDLSTRFGIAMTKRV